MLNKISELCWKYFLFLHVLALAFGCFVVYNSTNEEALPLASSDDVYLVCKIKQTKENISNTFLNCMEY